MTGSKVLLGVSEAIRDVEDDIALAARSDARVLISGESGVGKGVIARLIHQGGLRSGAPLVTVDCARASDSVLAAELFGHIPGRDPNSQHRRRGAFEVADQGTVFLDEVGDISLNVQTRLLRFLGTGEIQPIGSDYALLPLDVRVIAATRNPLGERIAAKRFNEELFYRLNVMHIAVPPLRERREDVVVLLNEFLSQFAGRAGTAPPELTPSAWEHLTDYSWPCNVRELGDVAARLVARCQAGRADVEDLPEEILARRTASRDLQGGPHRPDWQRPTPIHRRILEGWIDDRALGHLARLGFEYARVR